MSEGQVGGQGEGQEQGEERERERERERGNCDATRDSARVACGRKRERESARAVNALSGNTTIDQPSGTPGPVSIASTRLH